ncbi:hypothetical protein D0869_11572 [Hortaea werneckii]|uniref:Uncharacterized protein n=1 Tax=Hortaea werneckii TaxID=91943 RepID=A0A3M6WB44_HORWE|nr:hypothetical protein KC324_g11382 [Hortaea werneckii]KAI7586888.1 hypothetical protein KC316_g5337 [Hortaea werneckii]RMX75496.1 hypothetical protein D0869_11572 [Hortaea werneckii]RMX93183.1 hypothetical protein D0868_12995 [Hortaea werneckii]
MAPPINLNSQTWTIRFKHQRTTVLLHVDPQQQLDSVRAELLKALGQVCPDGFLHGHRLPDSEADILLAVPTDINDLNLGWDAVDRDEAVENAIEEEKGSGKGKGKAGVTGKGKASAGRSSDCPQTVGFRDGGIVAFKFRTQREAERDGNMATDEALVSGGEKEQWDVVVPTLDETYAEGEEAEGAEGVEGDEEIPVPTPSYAT